MFFKFYILYTRRKKRCNMFYCVKTNKAQKQSEKRVSALLCPKCGGVSVSYVMMMETRFGEVWGNSGGAVALVFIYL